jgi:hypothetical protein
MGLLDAYQDSTDTALRVMTSRPIEAEPPKPKHSAWTAPFRAVAAGGAEVVGNVIDTAAAFGQVAASVGGITPGFDPDQAKNRNATVDAMDRLKSEGINWRTDEGQQAYKFGADLRPDPLTAGTAENIVFGLTKGLTKAIGAATTFGPFGGAVTFGISEGMTAAEDLANQGVDQTTRTKVGAVTGVMNAAGVLLPVAGQTLAQTAALVVAGGPASFMAQQAATREILRNADYGKIAEQYDPLDMTGLLISFGLPAGFAAYAKRGGFAKPLPKADGQPIADNVAATQESSVAATPEAIDAAMVQNLTIARDAHESGQVPGIEFAQAKVENSNGKLVDGFAANFDNNKGGSGYIELAVDGNRIFPTMVDNGLFRLSETTGGAVSKVYEQAIAFAERNGKVFTSDDSVTVSASRVYDSLSRKGYDVQKNPAARLATSPEVITDRYLTDDGSPVYLVSPPKSEPSAAPLPTVKESLTTEFDTSGLATDQTPDAYAARVEALTKEQPDLIARLDDAGQPVKLTDELAAIKKQAQEGTDTDFGALDAPLLKVAAECALSIGTAGL